MLERLRLLLCLPLALSAGVVALSSCSASEPSISKLTLEPESAQKMAPGYYPVPIQLSAEKPAGVKQEPKYRAQPKYGVITLGGEGGTTYAIALDEPANGDWKIYLDANHNGDLTDDGDGAWASKREQRELTLYGVNHYILDVSWKLANGQVAEGKYGLDFVRPSDAPVLVMVRQGARTGTIELDGKAHKASLIENDGDALFHKPVSNIEEAKKGRPVWLLVDLNDDGKFDPQGGEILDIRGPFKLANRTYESTVSPDGATLKLVSSKKEALDLAPKDEQSERSPMLPEGTVAPNFKVLAPGGGTIELAKYRGKIVVLDFWSTWCGPCQMSMPHVEQVYQKVKTQGVVVLAVCVFDERQNFNQWLPQNKNSYHFQFAYDPGANDNEKSVAAKLYKTISIPATYVIDKDGKVAAAIPGFVEGDTRIEDALKKLGVRL